MNKEPKRSLHKRIVTALVTPVMIAFVAISAEAADRSATASQPNVIYIMADDLGYGDLGCYGQKRIKTPSIDRMAAEGLRFTDHYAGSTVCAPSRCVLMTGLHTGHSVVRNNKEVKPMGQMPLPPGTPTVARLLQKAGYTTALVGKWGLGGPGSTGIPNKQGFDKKTVVFFTSDNGPHREGGANPNFNDSNGPLRGIKRDLYDGGIRVPMIVRWPGRVRPGTETDHISAFWDFLPTACDLAGVEPPDNIDGISYLPTLLGDGIRQKNHEYLFWKYYGNWAVRMGQWKAVGQPIGNRFALFDLKTDLGESKNIAKDHPQIVDRMKKIMASAHVESPDFK